MDKIMPSCLDRGFYMYQDDLIKYLNDNGIGTIIHYPIPPHLSEAYQYLGLKAESSPITEKYAKYVLSIPHFNGMTKEEQDYVIGMINKLLCYLRFIDNQIWNV